MYDDEVNAYDQADRTSPPPINPIIFYGSSSIRLWLRLNRDFPGAPIINRAFGGSMLNECVELMDRLVLRYQPRAVVLYAGDNDLGHGRSVQDVIASFREFIARFDRACPGRPLAYISIKPSKARAHLRKEIEQTNALIRAEIANYPAARYISIFEAMQDSNGIPRDELFVEDMLHLSSKGYAVWREAVQPFIAEIMARSVPRLSFRSPEEE